MNEALLWDRRGQEPLNSLSDLDNSVSDNKRTDGSFNTERTVRSLIITTVCHSFQALGGLSRSNVAVLVCGGYKIDTSEA